VTSISNPSFPDPKPEVFGCFHLPETRLLTTKAGYCKKTWNCCCIQILVILITLKLQIGACNGQISVFELSTIIMRHEVGVLLGDHCTFVVGPFIFSIS